MFKAKNHSILFRELIDHDRIFPIKALNCLKNLDVFPEMLPQSYKNENGTETEFSQSIYKLLFEIGRGDLSVGRIIEGHVNALELIKNFGTKNQIEKHFKKAAAGKLFGIWNTERNFEALKIKNNEQTLILQGAKIFCSGALNVDYPLITAKTANGSQLVVLEPNSKIDLREDWSLWNPTGMRASVSCRIDFSGLQINKDQFLGCADDYYNEPYFSWGAARFSAVQLGCAQAIVDIVIKDLLKRERTNDPYQKARLGKMAILMESADLWLCRAEKIERINEVDYSASKRINFANMMRTVTVDICEEIMSLAEKSVGVQGMMKDHPLEKKLRDLRVYLKQAGPDATLVNVGKYLAEKNKKCQKETI